MQKRLPTPFSSVARIERITAAAGWRPVVIVCETLSRHGSMMTRVEAGAESTRSSPPSGLSSSFRLSDWCGLWQLVHSPAANGECTACHNPHQAAEAGLLLKERRKLCLECHEEKDLAGDPAHAQASGRSCLECHDPHLGQDKFLLKPGLLPLPQPKGPAVVK